MSTLTSDEEESRAMALPSQLAQRIDASFDELYRLTAEAAPPSEPPAPRAARGVTVRIQPVVEKLGVVQYVKGHGGARGVGVIITGEDKAVTRTERGSDDRFHLDLNVSLEGLDSYEVASVQRAVTQLRSLVAAARRENSDARIIQLLRAVAPPDPLADVELKVAEATTDLRREFIERLSLLTSAQVHERAGFPGNNPSATGHRWRKKGQVFSVNYGGRELFPAFQFGNDGRPLPIIGEVLAILARDSERTDWDNALWFAGESGWLDGKTPIELLQSAPDLLKQAAEQEVLRDER